MEKPPKKLLEQVLQNDYDIRTVQELLRHKNVKTTMIYTHVLNRECREVRSPRASYGKLSKTEYYNKLRANLQTSASKQTIKTIYCHLC